MFQHTLSCQIESKSNTIQRKAAPQSYQSIISCNNGRQVYVGPTSIIHAFIRKACRGEMNRSFHLFCFISPLGGAEILPISPSYTVLTHKHTTRTVKSRGSSIYWPAGSPAQSGEVPRFAHLQMRTNECWQQAQGERLYRRQFWGNN